MGELVTFDLLMEGSVDVGVECDGDPDIVVAGQDFSKVARTQTKVSPCLWVDCIN